MGFVGMGLNKLNAACPWFHHKNYILKALGKNAQNKGVAVKKCIDILMENVVILGLIPAGINIFHLRVLCAIVLLYVRNACT